MKELMAAEVREEIERSPNLLVVGLRPMSASQDLELRNGLRQHGARLRVIHNRTSRHALDEERAALRGLFVGQTAIALAREPETDLIPVAKALVDAARKKTIEVRGGYVDGEVLDRAGVEALASSPDKPTLRAMILGAVLGSGRGLAAAIQGVGGGLARCLQARIDAAGEAAAAE
jgi:large subunit ribosomal protein L10